MSTWDSHSSQLHNLSFYLSLSSIIKEIWLAYLFFSPLLFLIHFFNTKEQESFPYRNPPVNCEIGYFKPKMRWSIFNKKLQNKFQGAPTLSQVRKFLHNGPNPAVTQLHSAKETLLKWGGNDRDWGISVLENSSFLICCFTASPRNLQAASASGMSFHTVTITPSHPKPQHAALCYSDGTINICTQDRILRGACSKPPGFLDKMIISG